MAQIDTILSEDQLAMLRAGYDDEAMTALLSAGMPSLDSDTAGYIDAIRKAFYDRAERNMSPIDRERCLIGVLASREGGLNLALHVYVGLMEGLSPDDVSDVVFLAGIYTGVDRISDGLDTVMRTVTVLEQLATSAKCTVKEVASELVATFRPPLPSRT